VIKKLSFIFTIKKIVEIIKGK